MTMPLPSIKTMEILAVSDPVVFEDLINYVGLTIEGRINEDPLKSHAQAEYVAAMASELTENVHDYVEHDKHLYEFKKLAEDYGYIVSFSE